MNLYLEYYVIHKQIRWNWLFAEVPNQWDSRQKPKEKTKRKFERRKWDTEISVHNIYKPSLFFLNLSIGKLCCLCKAEKGKVEQQEKKQQGSYIASWLSAYVTPWNKEKKVASIFRRVWGVSWIVWFCLKVFTPFT